MKCTLKQQRSEPAQTTPESPDRETGKRALWRCKGGPGRALLVVKGRIGCRRGRITLRKGPVQIKTTGVKDDGNGMTLVVQEGDD